jgi:diaminopimelate decarboxylase
MASNYNARPLAAEVLVHGRQAAVVRRRQDTEEIWAREKIPAWLIKTGGSA